jgi:integrase
VNRALAGWAQTRPALRHIYQKGCSNDYPSPTIDRAAHPPHDRRGAAGLYRPFARTLAIRAGKGNKSRALPLHERLARELETTPFEQRRGAVLTDRHGQPISAKTLAHSFDARGWLRKEWQLMISAHQLRHVFATQLLIGGVDLRSI